MTGQATLKDKITNVMLHRKYLLVLITENDNWTSENWSVKTIKITCIATFFALLINKRVNNFV